jgi:hypothetical protein
MPIGVKKSHEEYVNELELIHPHIKAVDRYINTDTKILHKCIIDNYIWMVRPQDLLSGYGCPVCSGRKIGPAPEYKNSIWASKHREYFSQFLTEEQMKNYTPSSSKKIQATCPKCHKPKKITIYNLLYNGIGCTCSDHISFPNKYVFNILQQLKIDVIPEYTPKWAYGKRYDLYVPSLELIIENHGLQHYEERIFTGRTLSQEQANDANKKMMAYNHNINTYIVLDCRVSSGDFIQQSIMQSCLPNILNFAIEDIDWRAAEQYAQKDLTAEAIRLYNQGVSIQQIVGYLHVSDASIRNWLRRGGELGLCSYQTHRGRQQKVLCVELNRIFNSIKEAGAFIERTSSSIIFSIKHGGTSGGYHWQYIR